MEQPEFGIQPKTFKTSKTDPYLNRDCAGYSNRGLIALIAFEMRPRLKGSSRCRRDQPGGRWNSKDLDWLSRG